MAFRPNNTKTSCHSKNSIPLLATFDLKQLAHLTELHSVEAKVMLYVMYYNTVFTHVLNNYIELDN